MDEFVDFARPNMHISSESHEIQLWGTPAKYGDVDLQGVSIHWPDKWDFYNPDAQEEEVRELRLECVKDLADSAGVPLIWIGDYAADWRDLSGETEVGKIVSRDDGFTIEDRPNGGSGPIMCDIEPESDGDSDSSDSILTGSSELEQELQEIMGTDLEDFGTEKEVNRSTTPVQHWVRRSMPSDYAVMDVDILIGDLQGNTHGLAEIRRSSWPEDASPDDCIERWYPWVSDRRQYYLLADTGERASVDAVAIHHRKEQLDDDSPVGYYSELSYSAYSWDAINRHGRVTSEEKADEWLNFEKTAMSASDAIEKLKNMAE